MATDGGAAGIPTGGADATGGSVAVSPSGGALSTGGTQGIATGGTNQPPTGGASPVATGGMAPSNGGVGMGGGSQAATGGIDQTPTGGAVAGGGGSATGGTRATGGTAPGGTSAGGGSNVVGPRDIYAAASPPTPCVAAYSTVRLLNSLYTGPLYQVRKGDSDAGSEIRDIGIVEGGFADSAAQDTFCGTDACRVSIIYDQSGKGNHLTSAPASCYTGTANTPSNESDAKGRSLMVGGHKVYALYMIARDGYRNNQTTGMPTDDQAQGIYEAVDGTRYGTACCWDFGNGSTNNCPGPVGESNALFFGTGYWGKGAGDGPWFMADFQPGVWAGGSGASNVVVPENPSITYDFAMGILKTNATNYAIRVANAQSGNWVTAYDGTLPFATWKMKGGVILGLSSDASNSSYGTFFEGAIAAGRPSDTTDAAVLANVQAVKYGQ